MTRVGQLGLILIGYFFVFQFSEVFRQTSMFVLGWGFRKGERVGWRRGLCDELVSRLENHTSNLPQSLRRVGVVFLTKLYHTSEGLRQTSNLIENLGLTIGRTQG